MAYRPLHQSPSSNQGLCTPRRPTGPMRTYSTPGPLPEIKQVTPFRLGRSKSNSSVLILEPGLSSQRQLSARKSNRYDNGSPLHRAALERRHSRLHSEDFDTMTEDIDHTAKYEEPKKEAPLEQCESCFMWGCVRASEEHDDDELEAGRRRRRAQRLQNGIGKTCFGRCANGTCNRCAQRFGMPQPREWNERTQQMHTPVRRGHIRSHSTPNILAAAMREEAEAVNKMAPPGRFKRMYNALPAMPAMPALPGLPGLGLLTKLPKSVQNFIPVPILRKARTPEDRLELRGPFSVSDLDNVPDHPMKGPQHTPYPVMNARAKRRSAGLTAHISSQIAHAMNEGIYSPSKYTPEIVERNLVTHPLAPEPEENKKTASEPLPYQTEIKKNMFPDIARADMQPKPKRWSTPAVEYDYSGNSTPYCIIEPIPKVPKTPKNKGKTPLGDSTNASTGQQKHVATPVLKAKQSPYKANSPSRPSSLSSSGTQAGRSRENRVRKMLPTHWVGDNHIRKANGREGEGNTVLGKLKEQFAADVEETEYEDDFEEGGSDGEEYKYDWC